MTESIRIPDPSRVEMGSAEQGGGSEATGKVWASNDF